MGLPAAPRGQCSGAQLGSTPAGHTVPKGPRQGRPRPTSPSTRPAGEASCGAHSLCVGCRGLVSLGVWVLQKALPPGTRNHSGPCCQLTAVATGFPAHLIYKKHRRRPRLPSSFGSVPHTRVLCLVVLLGAVLRGRHDCYPPSILRSSVGTSRGHRGRTRHRWAWTRRWLRGLPCGRRTGPRRWLRLTSAEGLGRPGACGYPRCLLADGVRLPHCWRQGWEREGEGRG